MAFSTTSVQMDTTQSNSPSGECERAAPSHQQQPSHQPSHLYNHALESIFAWLSLAELASVMVTCKRWNHIVGVTMKRTEGNFCFRARTALPIAPSLARHVGHMTMSAFCGITAAALFERFPYLQSFAGALFIADAKELVQFRPSLTRVQIAIHSSVSIGPNGAAMNYVLHGLSVLPHLRSITVWLGFIDNVFSLGALRNMRQLEKLTVEIRDHSSTRFSHSFLDELRALTWLKNVHVSRLDNDADLSYLFRHPCDLQWEHIVCGTRFTQGFLDAVQSLRYLTHINAYCVISIDERDGHESTDALVRSSTLAVRLGAIPKLTSLRLTSSFMHTVDMNRIMSTCRLQTLVLQGIGEWDSFDCFQSGPITHTLLSLHIGHCDSVPSTEVSKLSALTALRTLHIARMWSPNDVRKLYIPSPILPHLETFTYV